MKSTGDLLVRVTIRNLHEVVSQGFKVQEEWLHLFPCVSLKDTEVTKNKYDFYWVKPISWI